MIVLRKLFDQQGIFLKNINSTKAANFKRLFHSEFCENWMLLDPKQEHQLRIGFRRSKDHVITLKYQVTYDQLSRENNCWISSVEP